MPGPASLAPAAESVAPIAESAAPIAESVAPIAKSVAPIAESAATAALQSGRFDSAAAVALQAAEFLGAFLGLFVAYQAYRGYRRNDSRPMLFIATGFAVIMGVPMLVFVPAFFLTDVPVVAIQSVVQAFEIVGILCIIYALRMEP